MTQASEPDKSAPANTKEVKVYILCESKVAIIMMTSKYAQENYR